MSTIPREPGAGLEYDFRMSPTRISAKRLGGLWVIYEREIVPITRDAILCFRPTWADAYVAGKLIVRDLDGKTTKGAQEVPQ
jgi:hypothetical protein